MERGNNLSEVIQCVFTVMNDYILFIDAGSDSSDSDADDVSPLDHPNYAKLTPLLLAVKEDCPVSVEKLVRANCSLRIGIDSVDKTAVHLAAKLNRAKCLEVMMDASDEVVEQLKKTLVEQV